MKHNDLQLITNDTNKLTKDLVDALFLTLQEQNPYALDISEFYSNSNYEMCKDIIQIYAEAIWYGVNKALSDPVVIRELTNRAKQMGIEGIRFDINEFNKKVINEYLLNFTNFKEKKGLKSAIEYVYNIMIQAGLQPGIDASGDNGFNLRYGSDENPEEPFFLRIEGLINPILYESSVKSIAHPVGFGYYYVINLLLNFTEYVDDKVGYIIKKLAIICSEGGKYDYSDKPVKDIVISKNIQNKERIVIIFEDNSVLIKNFDDSIIMKDQYGDVIGNWGRHCKLQLDYEISLIFLLRDEFSGIEVNTVLYDCVWNTFVDEKDVLRIGYFYVNDPRPISGNSVDEYWIRIGHVYPGFTERIPGDPTVYTHLNLDLLITNALNKGIFKGFIEDKFFSAYTETEFVDNVSSDRKYLLIGDYELIVGNFTVQDAPDNLVTYADSMTIEKSSETTFSDTYDYEFIDKLITDCPTTFTEQISRDNTNVTNVFDYVLPMKISKKKTTIGEFIIMDDRDVPHGQIMLTDGFSILSQ